MTEGDPGRHGDPPAPTAPPSGPSRDDDLARWIERNHKDFTIAALRATALKAGYSQESFEAALQSDQARTSAAHALTSTKTRARWVVLASYAIVWLVFAIPYLTWDTVYGYGPLAQGILTVMLGIALLVSWLWTRSRRPNPADTNRAMFVLLSVPLVLLVVLGGLCLPFVPRPL